MEIIIITIVILIISVIIHEVAHGWAANALGDPTAKLQGRLSLNPMRHIDPVGSILVPALLAISSSGFLFGWAKPVPYNPYNLRNQRWGEAIVGSAGVLTNLFLAVVFAGIVRFTADAGMLEFAMLAAVVVSVNLSLGLFNLLPIPPLDGYTVLRGILPYRMSMTLRDFEDRVNQGGILSLILILFLFSYFLSAPFGAFISYVFHFLIGA